MTSFPSVINLSGLDGSNGFQINGEAPGDASGISLSAAGDVNGDGFADLIIGAPGADPAGDRSGASYVVFGHASGWGANFELSTLNGTNGFRISGQAAGAHSGTSVSSAGDVNGDGLADLIIGAPGQSGGVAYVVFGKPSGFSADLDPSTLTGNNGFRITGGGVGDSVASAGDVNGDGFADLLVGDFDYYSSGAFLIFGRGSGFAATVDVTKLNGSNGFQILGGYYGGIGASAGDVNGDGFNDVIMGDPYSSSFVVFGRASGFPAAVDPLSLNGATGFRVVQGGQWIDAAGSGAGDINGDGFADLIIGTPRANPNGAKSGASYVVFGKASGFAATFDLSSLDGANGFRINGEAANDESGRRVSGAGDVNGDGFSDLIIGAPDADPNGASSGASYVIFGKEWGFAANFALSSLNGVNGFKIAGEAAHDYSGVVSAAGDINGDGFGDLLVGAPGADPNGSSSGASYILFGHSTEMPATSVSDNDFNGDGMSDILWRNDNGAVAIWEMNGTALQNGKIIPGAETISQSWHIAGTGDFNADGMSDILWRNDNGAVAIWEMNGTALQNGKIIPGAEAISQSWHIAGTGDFNADGMSDILWRNDNGAVAIWEMNGTALQNGKIIPGAEAISQSWHIAGTGDFNADGKSDILWRNDNGAVAIWEMNGTALQNGKIIPGAETISQSWHIAGTGDFNADGMSDILWRNDNGAVAIWEMNGTALQNGKIIPGAEAISQSWHIAGTGDFNADGMSDILWRNDNGAVAIWEMNGTALQYGAVVPGAEAISQSWHIEGYGLLLS